MKNRLFGHFSFVYSEIFSHAAKCFKIKSCLRKTTKVFVLNTRPCEELSIFHLVSSRGLFSKL